MAAASSIINYTNFANTMHVTNGCSYSDEDLAKFYGAKSGKERSIIAVEGARGDKSN